MSTRTNSIAQLSALLAVKHGLSAYRAAECSIKLHTLSASIAENAKWQCNGFNTDYQGKAINKLTQQGKCAEANALATEIWNAGDALHTKRVASHDRKLSRLLAEYDLPADCVRPSDTRLSGLVFNGSFYLGA
jgi:hypothetical protein